MIVQTIRDGRVVSVDTRYDPAFGGTPPPPPAVPAEPGDPPPIAFYSPYPIAALSIDNQGNLYCYGNLIGPAAPTLVKPSGDATGATDSAAIAAALPNAQLLPGTYNLSGPVSLASFQSLRGVGPATILQPGSAFSGTAMVQLTATSTLQTFVRDFQISLGFKASVTGINITNTNPPTDPTHVLENITVFQSGSDGFFLKNSSGTQLRGCIALQCLGNGFTLQGFDMQISQCQAGVNAGHGFDVACTNCMITNSKGWFSGFNAQTSTWTSTTACGFFLDSGPGSPDYNTITNCSAQQNALHGFSLTGTHGTLSGCESDTNAANTSTGDGIFVNSATNWSLTGNVGGNNGGLSPGAQKWGIEFSGTNTGTALSGNTIAGSSGPQTGAPVTSLALAGTWTAGTPAPEWWLIDQNTVGTAGVANITPSISGNSQIATTPAAQTPNRYTPIFGCTQTNAPVQVAITNSGQLEVIAAPAGTTQVFWNGTYAIQS